MIWVLNIINSLEKAETSEIHKPIYFQRFRICATYV